MVGTCKANEETTARPLVLRVGWRVGLVGCRHMARQIHAVVKQPEYFDHRSVRCWCNLEDDEVSSLAPVAGDVQGMDARTDFLAQSNTGQGRALRKILQGTAQGFGIGSGLGAAKVFDGPAQYGLVVLSGRLGKTYGSAARHAQPMASAASPVRCWPSA